MGVGLNFIRRKRGHRRHFSRYYNFYGSAATSNGVLFFSFLFSFFFFFCHLSKAPNRQMEREKIFHLCLMYSTLVFFFSRLSEFRDSRFSPDFLRAVLTFTFRCTFGLAEFFGSVLRRCPESTRISKIPSAGECVLSRVVDVLSPLHADLNQSFALMAHANFVNLSLANEFFTTCLISRK